MLRTLYWEDGTAMIMDQTRLPHEVTYINCTDYLMVADCIKTMKVRGAPAIGIATGMAIALGAQTIDASNYEEFARGVEQVCVTLLMTRPTAVNIKWAVERMRGKLEGMRDEPIENLKQFVIDEAQRILDEDTQINRAIGKWGAEFIKDGARILTHCNAGGLATGGFGTATGPIVTAHEEGKRVSVFANETRPLLQGARLTAWELMQSGIPVTLIPDSAAGALMARGEIDMVIVGTDRTARNGDVANKIGTYTVAVLCREHDIPFYVAAPLSSIDFAMDSGDQIPIEERDPEEVTNICGQLQIAPEGVNVRNIAFDITPAKYVTAIITEKGAFRPDVLWSLNEEGADLEGLRL